MKKPPDYHVRDRFTSRGEPVTLAKLRVRGASNEGSTRSNGWTVMTGAGIAGLGLLLFVGIALDYSSTSTHPRRTLAATAEGVKTLPTPATEVAPVPPPSSPEVPASEPAAELPTPAAAQLAARVTTADPIAQTVSATPTPTANAPNANSAPAQSTPTPTPSPSATPTPSAAAAAPTPTATPTPAPTPASTPTPTPAPTPASTPTPTPAPTSTPKPTSTPSPSATAHRGNVLDHD